MTEAGLTPETSQGRKFSSIWIIPLVSLIAGAWMVVHTILSQGPTITISFETAEGLEAGKTKVKILNVDVGLVESVRLRSPGKGVVATVKLEKEAEDLLGKDTRFWVVRARIGAQGIQGLSTILSGGYIELSPGNGTEKVREFIGLEEPPLTPVDAPGMRLQLYAAQAGAVSVGDSVLYRGYEVGRVEAMEFNVDNNRAEYNVFIDAPFHKLVKSSTRFWNASGVSLVASAQGLELNMGSLETVLRGGITFDAIPGLPLGETINVDEPLKLYDSYDDVLENPYRYGRYYVVKFSQSLRGLESGAPVEYRGIEVGRVVRILLKELTREGMMGMGQDIPVLIYLEPGRMGVPDVSAATDALTKTIEVGVQNGLRATLETGNLLTGKQLVTLNYYPEEDVASLSEFNEYAVIPTVQTGVDRLEQQIRSFLDKLNALPLEATVASANDVIGQLNTTLSSVNSLLEHRQTQALPENLTATINEFREVLDGFSQDSNLYQNLGYSVNELNRTLENLDELSRRLADNPNSLIFSGSHKADPKPEAP
ncbi:intermembrane transport protein PqiB [Maricurvus nonylphenolicus]|uniref:intermembrane transport protein PqiB n=1 Tax=Maricurvus nonylphenolicus TaxID=1008307 RepID=UPI0036F2D1FB